MSRQTPKVYIIERMPFDYAAAAGFGEVEFMEGPKLAPDAPNETGMCRWNSIIVSEALHQLGGYIPGLDYIIPTGSPAKIMMVGMLLATKGGAHKILKWDDRTQRYICHTLGVKPL